MSGRRVDRSSASKVHEERRCQQQQHQQKAGTCTNRHEEEAKKKEAHVDRCHEQFATTSRHRGDATDCDRSTEFRLTLFADQVVERAKLEAEHLQWVKYKQYLTKNKSHKLLVSCLSHSCGHKIKIRSKVATNEAAEGFHKVQIEPLTGSGGANASDEAEAGAEETLELKLSQTEEDTDGSPRCISIEVKLGLDEDLSSCNNKNVTRFLFSQRQMSIASCSCINRQPLASVVLHKVMPALCGNSKQELELESSLELKQESSRQSCVDDRLLRKLAAVISVSHFLSSQQASLVSKVGPMQRERACCCARRRRLRPRTRHQRGHNISHRLRTCSRSSCDSTAPCQSVYSSSGSSSSCSSSNSGSRSRSSSKTSRSDCSLSRDSSRAISMQSRSSSCGRLIACSGCSSSLVSSCTSFDESRASWIKSSRGRNQNKVAKQQKMLVARSNCDLPTAAKHLHHETPACGVLRLKCPNCRMSFRSATSLAKEPPSKVDNCAQTTTSHAEDALPEEKSPAFASEKKKSLQPIQLDPKNLLSPMDFVWRGLSAESRALSCTEASLSDDTSSIVAQLAAAARSKSLCTEADSPRLKRLNQQQQQLQHQEQQQQKRLNLSGRIRGCVGRLTRNAINHIKLLSVSNPNIGRRPDEMDEQEDDANEVVANQSNYGAISRKRRASSLVRGNRRPTGKQQRQLGGNEVVVTHKLNRFGSCSAANLDSSATMQNQSIECNRSWLDDQSAPYYSPDGIYIGPGGILSRSQLERQWFATSGKGKPQNTKASNEGGTTSWLTRPLRATTSISIRAHQPAQAPNPVGQTKSDFISGRNSSQMPPQVLIELSATNRDNNWCPPAKTSNCDNNAPDLSAQTADNQQQQEFLPTPKNHLFGQQDEPQEGMAANGCAPLGQTQGSGTRQTKNSSPKPWLLNLTQRSTRNNRKNKQQQQQQQQQQVADARGSRKEPLEACESLRLSGSSKDKSSFHLTRETRSNSLSGPLGPLSQFADLSKSTIELNFSHIAEQTSLYLAELSSKYSGSTHELTPPAAKSSDHWFSRRSSVKPAVHQEPTTRGSAEQHLQRTDSRDLPEDKHDDQLVHSSKAQELYGANLVSICVHCQLIAELANHPASSYLSQLLSSGGSGAAVANRQSSATSASRLALTGEPVPSVVLTVCSNQATVEDEEQGQELELEQVNEGSGGIEQHGPAADDRLMCSIDSVVVKESGHKEKLGRGNGRACSRKNKSKSKKKKRKGNMKKRSKAGRRRQSSSTSTSASLVNLSQEETTNTTATTTSSSSSSKLNVLDNDCSDSKRANQVLARHRSNYSDNSLSPSTADSSESEASSRLFEDDDEEEGGGGGEDDSEEDSPVLSSQSSASASANASDSEWRLVTSRKQNRRRAGRKRRRQRKGCSPAASEGKFAAIDGEVNVKSQSAMLTVPCNKQARSASLDAPYLLKVPDLLEDTSQTCAKETQGSIEALKQQQHQHQQASGSSAATSNYLQPGAKSNRSRSVDISLPTQPGECYLVRQMAAGADLGPQNSSVINQHQHALGRRGTGALTDHMVASGSGQKKFIQSEIEIPCANGGTRALKLYVNWQDNCINGEHLWLYAGSSSEACYVGETECLKHGPRLCCSACKITAHTGCINILIDKIKFICKHTFKDLTVNNQRHTREQQNVIYHHWVHKRTHRGRCRQCTKTFGNTKLPFSSKEIQAITCSWCKVSYHNKENCYTLSALTEPCALGVHRESIIPSTWILKLPSPAAKEQQLQSSQNQDMDDVSQLQQADNLIDTSTAAQANAFKVMTDGYCKENNEKMSNRQQRQQSNNVTKKTSNPPLTYGSNATLMTDTSGYISAEGLNALMSSNQNKSATNESLNNELIIDPTALQLADLSAINQLQIDPIKNSSSTLQDAKNRVNHNTQQCNQRLGDNDSEDTSMFLDLQSLQQQEHFNSPNEQPYTSLYHNFKIVPQSIQGIPNAGSKPVLVFVNPRSGGNQGAKMMQKFNWLLNPRQVFDLIQSGGPRSAIELYRDVPNLRILTIGGDGTASWILSHLDEVGIPNKIPVAVLPLGTGNDLARALGWGGGYADEPIAKILTQVRDGEIVQLDRWNLQVERNFEAAPSSPNEYSTSSIYTGSNNMELGSPSISSSPSYFGSLSQANNTASTISIIDQTNCDINMGQGNNANSLSGFNAPDEAGACDRLPMDVINNYFSFGVDAQIALEFHTAREAHPEKFNSRLRNKMFYGQAGGKDLLKRKWKDLSNFVTLYCDGQDMTSRLKELKVHSVLFLNIPSYGGGTRPWPTTATSFAKPRTDDGLIEVIGLTTYQLPLLQAGGHGTCIAQCRTAKIITSRTIPMQVDGEPCKLLPSVININLKNRVCMLAKSKSSNKSANMTNNNMQKS